MHIIHPLQSPTHLFLHLVIFVHVTTRDTTRQQSRISPVLALYVLLAQSLHGAIVDDLRIREGIVAVPIGRFGVFTAFFTTFTSKSRLDKVLCLFLVKEDFAVFDRDLEVKVFFRLDKIEASGQGVWCIVAGDTRRIGANLGGSVQIAAKDRGSDC